MARQTLIYAFDEDMTKGDYAFVMLQLEQEQFIRNIKRPGQIFVLLNLPTERQCDYNQALESVILVEINSTVDQKAYEAFEKEVEQNFHRFSPGLSLKRQVSALLHKALVASWLVRSSPGQAVWVRALAGDIVLCSFARQFTLTITLSTQVYKWVPAKVLPGGPCRRLASHPGRSRHTPSCFMNQ